MLLSASMGSLQESFNVGGLLLAAFTWLLNPTWDNVATATLITYLIFWAAMAICIITRVSFATYLCNTMTIAVTCGTCLSGITLYLESTSHGTSSNDTTGTNSTNLPAFTQPPAIQNLEKLSYVAALLCLFLAILRLVAWFKEQQIHRLSAQIEALHEPIAEKDNALTAKTKRSRAKPVLPEAEREEGNSSEQ